MSIDIEVDNSEHSQQKLMLSGAGSYEFAILGAVHALATADKLKCYSLINSSANVTGFMLALGKNIEEIGNYLTTIRPRLKEYKADRLEVIINDESELLQKYKVLKKHSKFIDADNFYNYIQLIVQDVFGAPDATFSDLAKYVKALADKKDKIDNNYKFRNLELTATISTKTKPHRYMQIILSKDKTPNMPLALAMRLANSDHNLDIIQLSEAQLNMYFDTNHINEIVGYEIDDIINEDMTLAEINFENCILPNFETRIPLYSTLEDLNPLTIIAPFPEFIIDAVNNFTDFKTFKSKLIINTKVDDFFDKIATAIVPELNFNKRIVHTFIMPNINNTLYLEYKMSNTKILELLNQGYDAVVETLDRELIFIDDIDFSRMAFLKNIVKIEMLPRFNINTKITDKLKQAINTLSKLSIAFTNNYFKQVVYLNIDAIEYNLKNNHNIEQIQAIIGSLANLIPYLNEYDLETIAGYYRFLDEIDDYVDSFYEYPEYEHARNICDKVIKHIKTVIKTDVEIQNFNYLEDCLNTYQNNTHSQQIFMEQVENQMLKTELMELTLDIGKKYVLLAKREEHINYIYKTMRDNFDNNIVQAITREFFCKVYNKEHEAKTIRQYSHKFRKLLYKLTNTTMPAAAKDNSLESFTHNLDEFQQHQIELVNASKVTSTADTAKVELKPIKPEENDSEPDPAITSLPPLQTAKDNTAENSEITKEQEKIVQNLSHLEKIKLIDSVGDDIKHCEVLGKAKISTKPNDLDEQNNQKQ